MKKYTSFLILLLNVGVLFGADRLPLVYCPGYNISFFGIENMHKFDSKKYGKVHEYLIQNGRLSPDQFYYPEEVSDADLSLVHTKEYLDSLSSSSLASVIAGILEIGALALLPNWFFKEKVLRPMKLATGGTILGAILAMRYGWAINLSGGYHHAKDDHGEAFCIFADIPIAAKKLLLKFPNFKILIVDLDVHQGNGHERILKDEQRVVIFDVYNKDIYPLNGEYDNDTAGMHVEFGYPLESGMTDNEYLNLLSLELPKVLDSFRPDLIFYNAGTDIHEDDALGQFAVSENGIIKRDAFVFKLALNRKIPIVMTLAGGYAPQSASIIARSIANLCQMISVNSSQ